MTARRLLVATLAFVAVAGSALAADKMIDPNRVFPYLQAYWKLPPAERNRFAPAYVFKHNGQPLAVPVAIVQGAASNPIPMRPDGRVGRLPTLAELESGKLHVGLDEKDKFTSQMQVEALLRPAAQMEVRELVAAIDQATAGEKKVAGFVGFMAPKMTEVGFEGVPSGEVRFSDGRKAPLPVESGFPVFAPAKFPGAVMLVFPKTPTRIQIG
jgi:hypothetical protein